MLCSHCKVIVPNHPTAAMQHIGEHHPEEWRQLQGSLNLLASVLTGRHFELDDVQAMGLDQAAAQLLALVASINDERKRVAEVRASKLYRASHEVEEHPMPGQPVTRKRG